MISTVLVRGVQNRETTKQINNIEYLDFDLNLRILGCKDFRSVSNYNRAQTKQRWYFQELVLKIMMLVGSNLRKFLKTSQDKPLTLQNQPNGQQTKQNNLQY